MQRALLASWCLLAVSCESEPEPRTRSEFCSDWARAACSSEAVSRCQARDVNACRATQRRACLERVPANFADEMGDECLEAVDKAYADGDLQGEELATVYALAGACSSIVVGPGRVDDPCSTDRDCDSLRGLVCARKSTQDQGTCQDPQRVAPGRDCESLRKVCSEGFYCDGSHCIEAKRSGESCGFHAECDPDAFCNPDGVCEAGRKVSEACNEDVECSSGVCLEFEDTKSCTDRIVLSRSDPACDDLR